MKALMGAVLSLFALVLSPVASMAEIQPLAILSASVGAERETGEPNAHGVGRGGARGGLNFLGVIPFGIPAFGLQANAGYVGGQGSRFGAGLGPVYDFGAGKTGVMVNYQHRPVRDGDFFWVTPTMALYFDQMNLNISYAHPISPWQVERCGDFCRGKREDTKAVDIATNRLQAAVSYFPAVDFGMVRKDNLELTFGVQVNNFGVGGSHFAQSAGVGPVFGASVMPWQNVEVNLIKASFDNRSRYQVNSGVSYFFARGGASLKDLRRKYLDSGPGPVAGFTRPMHD